MPRVSIVIPVFNDEEFIAAALDSSTGQTLEDIEIICVDDASTDNTVSVIEGYQRRDPRIRLLQQERNLSAFQARRVGVMAARSPYTLFLDGDDGLAPATASAASEKAVATEADMVGFGSLIVRGDGRTGGAFEKRLQPAHASLEGAAILKGIFPIGKPASGQIWRYLFRTEVLREAYSYLPEGLVLRRANDVPLMFLVAALAQRYVSIPDRLYRYSFGSGGSGQRVGDMERAEFYVSAIDSIDSIASAVRKIAWLHSEPGLVMDSYDNVRKSVIGFTTGYLVRQTSAEMLPEVLSHLHTRASATDILVSAARFSADALAPLKSHGQRIELGERPARHVLLTTLTLRTGGVSGVLLAQARYLLEAGYRVTIVAKRAGSDRSLIPEGASFIESSAKGLSDRLAEWARICREYEIDVAIDHQILYTRDWPEYAMAARAVGVPTIGWIHNFAGRPVYDLKDLHSLMQRNMHLLARLVVLSELDVAFWKLRGVPHTVYLPNPPSPMLIESSHSAHHKTAPEGRIELVWWGRLEQHTKRVLQLIEVAEQLEKRGLDFRLNVIGPDWGEMTAESFNAEAQRRGLGERVEAIGPRRGKDLTDAIDSADAFVNVSIIEGYPLTLPEAQSRGLPVFMYELPWLALVQDNDGIVAVPQDDAAAIAERIDEVFASPERYEAMSEASLRAGQRAMSYDFSQLWQQLITGTLPGEYSPEPTLEDAQRLIDLLLFFSERNAGLLKRK
ncbi:glycosyltransferase [Nesterenkonia ebinurensis]|uniref:glycosyltransferase n=1 Tax=Nesterenkonia ebinurensis TaxID=2608252 RepID=UPI00123D42D0|nr:glycosyltransferase [Nesterenkonia ebinurensis]